MKKSHKYYMDKRVSFFLLLVIISACGIYYSLWRRHTAKAIMGNAVEAVDETEMQESFEKLGGVTAEISGAVVSPGVYSLNAGDTVGKLVEMAGGFTEEADKEELDLSANVFHLQEIVVGSAEGESKSKYSHDLVQLYYPPDEKEEALILESQKININTASSTEFQRLPGIGPKLADSIVAYREEHGQFNSLEDLKNISKIGEKTFAAIADYITLGSTDN